MSVELKDVLVMQGAVFVALSTSIDSPLSFMSVSGPHSGGLSKWALGLGFNNFAKSIVSQPQHRKRRELNCIFRSLIMYIYIFADLYLIFVVSLTLKISKCASTCWPCKKVPTATSASMDEVARQWLVMMISCSMIGMKVSKEVYRNGGRGEGVGEVCEIMRKICSVFGAGI